jgi:hypothetical protein
MVPGTKFPKFQVKMAQEVQFLINLNKNFFNLFDCEPKVRFDFAVKKFFVLKKFRRSSFVTEGKNGARHQISQISGKNGSRSSVFD